MTWNSNYGPSCGTAMAELQTADELAPSLKVSARMLQRLAQRGQIPSYRIGRLLRFDPEAVRRALQKEGDTG
jgi:excisionase family DNA binding protein